MIRQAEADQAIAAIKRALTRFPELTDFGFGVFDERRLPPTERAEQFRANRALMFETRSLDGFQRACDWLTRQRRTKQINPGAGSSYGLKHAAEYEVGYVTNGMFIAAAVACGFRVKRIADSPNAHLNISTTANNTAWRGDGTPIRLGHVVKRHPGEDAETGP